MNRVPFDGEFPNRSPAFEFIDSDLRAWLSQLKHFPSPERLAALGSCCASPPEGAPTFITLDRRQLDKSGGYEAYVAKHRKVPTRKDNWHDFLNAIVWLHFPKLKWRLNSVQLEESDQRDRRNNRSPRQNAAALFDECGAILLSHRPDFFHAIEELRWDDLFLKHSEAVKRHLKVIVIGHGLLEQLLRPRVGITAKAIFVPCLKATLKRPISELSCFLDASLAARINRSLYRPGDLRPFPLMGMPGWLRNQDRLFYSNERYFRRARRASAKAERQPT